MTTYVFEPEVDEEDWLDIGTHNLWPVWRSMPYPEGWEAPDRKKLLLVAHLLRHVADQLTDARFVATIDAGELGADGLISQKEMWESHEQAYRVYDTTRQPHEAARAAAYAAQRYVYEQNETSEIVIWAAGERAAHLAGGKGDPAEAARREAEQAMQGLIRRLINEVHGNPFRPVAFSLKWRTGAAVSLARQMYETRDFSAAPILADALEEAGCTDGTVLDHLRGPGLHIRGCWVVDLVLEK
jgi:hypothetical protein